MPHQKKHNQNVSIMLNDVVTDACNMKQNNAFNFKHCQDN